jgi:hypothetical protein
VDESVTTFDTVISQEVILDIMKTLIDEPILLVSDLQTNEFNFIFEVHTENGKQEKIISRDWFMDRFDQKKKMLIRKFGMESEYVEGTTYPKEWFQE